jgi:Flp pilus assembly protein TadG
MSQHAGAHGRLSGIRATSAQFTADRRGVAAIEFAFMAPLLLCMYFVTMEASQAIETDKKVSRIGSMVGDLVTQQQSVTVAELNSIMDIGGQLLAPYSRSLPKITITAIEITDEVTPKVKVVWQRVLDDTSAHAYTAGLQKKGDIITVPDQLNTPGSFLIRVESHLAYKPVLTWAAGDQKALGLTEAFNTLSLGATYYLRPRQSSQVTCTDC